MWKSPCRACYLYDVVFASGHYFAFHRDAFICIEPPAAEHRPEGNSTCKHRFENIVSSPAGPQHMSSGQLEHAAVPVTFSGFILIKTMIALWLSIISQCIQLLPAACTTLLYLLFTLKYSAVLAQSHGVLRHSDDFMSDTAAHHLKLGLI